MKVSILVLCLALLSTSFSTIVVQSSTSSPIVSPAGAQATLAANPPSYSISGASWIGSSKRAFRTVYESLFYSNCNGSSTLLISTTAEIAIIYFDDVQIGTISFASQQISKFSLDIVRCGNHNLTIVVTTPREMLITNINKLPIYFLIFAIEQDQSNCFNCQVTGYWNENTCSCQCINPKSSECPCQAPQTWRGYPACGCRCPRIFTILPIDPSPPGGIVNLQASNAAASSNANANAASNTVGSVDAGIVDPSRPDFGILPICPFPKFQSPVTCKCVCHHTIACGPKHYFDEESCQCRQYIF